MKARPGMVAPRLLLLATVTVAACGDVMDGTPTDPRANLSNPAPMPGRLGALLELRDSILEVRIDLRRDPMAPELSDAELENAIRAAGGKAAIGFKPPGTQPTRMTGVYPAMSRAAALAARQTIEQHGVRITRTFVNSATVVVELPPEIAPVLRRLPDVNYIEAIRSIELMAQTFPQDTSWGARKVEAPRAWSSFSNAGYYANITILDSGIDQTHRWDSNGDGPANVGVDCYYDSAYFTDCYDDLPHGSHVAGIASSKNNEYGMIGVAYDPYRFASVKVCGYIAGGRGCPSDAIASALDWTASNGRPRQVVNMSLGSAENSALIQEFVVRSADAGNLLIAAAGNNPNPWGVTSVFYPARYSQVIAVSGTLEDDSFASSFYCPNELGPVTIGANFGAEVEVSAPFWAESMKLNGDYGIDCGTSMAAPVVSAIAAMVWTKYPGWSAAQVRNRIQSSVVDLGPSGRDNRFGYGRVNAYYALYEPPPVYTATINGSSEVQPFATCTWIVSTNLPSPTTYEWTVDGAPAGSNSPSFTYVAGDSPFTLAVTVRDQSGTIAWGDQSVNVSVFAAQCNDV